jgi:hypothetical protein
MIPVGCGSGKFRQPYRCGLAVGLGLWVVFGLGCADEVSFELRVPYQINLRELTPEEPDESLTITLAQPVSLASSHREAAEIVTGGGSIEVLDLSLAFLGSDTSQPLPQLAVSCRAVGASENGPSPVALLPALPAAAPPEAGIQWLGDGPERLAACLEDIAFSLDIQGRLVPEPEGSVPHGLVAFELRLSARAFDP